MTAIVLGLAALLVAQASIAQTSIYPSRPVKMVAPFAPGGPVDVVARVLAPKLSEGLGQQFYVENHPGGSGNIGTALVAKAPPDGHAVLVISSTLVVNPSLLPSWASTPPPTSRPYRSSAYRRKCCWCIRPFRRPASKSSSPG
jgi:tripartite-type tricarboxylate transporter receptor subunit TctC